MEGPEKKAASTDLGEYARKKREEGERPYSKSPELKMICDQMRPSFEKPEVREAYPGLTPEALMQVYMEALVIMRDCTAIQHAESEKIAEGASTQELAAAIIRAHQYGMNPQTAPQYLAYAVQIFADMNIPDLEPTPPSRTPDTPN